MKTNDTVTISKKEFAKELKNNFIPTTQRMIDKERKHLDFLRESKKKMAEHTVIGIPFAMNTESVDGYIEISNANLKHMIKRLEEYEAYVKEHGGEI